MLMKNKHKNSPDFYIGACEACGNKHLCKRAGDYTRLCEDYVLQTGTGKKFDTEKLRYDLVPMDALDAIVKRFTHGAAKYTPGNWQKVDDAVERYSAALMRHFSAYRQGERDDPEAPGLSHIGAVAWNALVLVWFALRGRAPEKIKKSDEN
jgi:hypothetical protein